MREARTAAGPGQVVGLGVGLALGEVRSILGTKELQESPMSEALDF